LFLPSTSTAGSATCGSTIPFPTNHATTPCSSPSTTFSATSYQAGLTSSRLSATSSVVFISSTSSATKSPNGSPFSDQFGHCPWRPTSSSSPLSTVAKRNLLGTTEKWCYRQEISASMAKLSSMAFESTTDPLATEAAENLLLFVLTILTQKVGFVARWISSNMC